MRTTLTLDDDVAASLKHVMKKRRQRLKAVVNEALRVGLDSLAKPAVAPTPFQIRPFNLGASLVGSLDNIEEVLSRVEGEDHT
jgi:hypothetical protein